ncbi:PREDICTED: INO80 complex subunit D-like isoform X1 [Camelina sativa]|uniref:KAT8 regulatory NSL complex subunit 2 n=1 Tax=Camelina sativa TaxID=90675 RepID=A0ABM0VKR1_CAMSA|nr:PREDICTED: INO80 complex subunit D-like isoform X1 [Camelina sativa]XP_010457694.1 PREDICTED: INO80 complex subunit D-like isoform X1 [Camelina sativa]
MASGSKQNPSSSKPPRHPSPITASIPSKFGVPEESQSRNPNNNPSSSPISMAVEDQILGRSTHLTRPELLRRRSHNLKQLARCYRDHYWALMEDLKAQHRYYSWNYGVSPFKDENHQQNKRRKVEGGHTGDEIEGSGDNDNNNSNDGVKSGNCVACGSGCKSKAMALTNYCQLHILMDKKQKLYTSCTYVNKRAQSKAITCPKPTLASTVPALCNVHFQKAQKDVARALKDAGHNVSSASRPPPKLHDIVAAFVHHIQTKRKDPRKEAKLKSLVKEEITS